MTSQTKTSTLDFSALRECVRIIENFMMDHPYAIVLKFLWVLIGCIPYLFLLAEELIDPEKAP